MVGNVASGPDTRRSSRRSPHRWRTPVPRGTGASSRYGVALHRDGKPLAEPGEEFLTRHRTAQEKALDDVATESRQSVPRRLVLYTFGNNPEPEVVCEIDDRTNQPCIRVVRGHPENEG